MKNKSKYISLLAIILGMATAIPVFAVAPGSVPNTNAGMKNNNSQEKREERQAKVAENVCQRISNMASQEEQRLTQRMGAPKNRLQNWQTKTTQRDSELTKLRSNWDTNRTAQFTKLEARATTDAQKQAVADFEATTKTAIATRQAAVDSAIAAFREGVKNLISGRTEDVTTSFTTFSDAAKAAYETAKSDCASGKDPATVRTTLRNALAAAKTKFHSDKTSAPKVGGNVQPLIDARRAAVQTAMKNFKATMEKARTDLKKAFPNDNIGTGTTEPAL
jgi:hypothetical protein